MKTRTLLILYVLVLILGGAGITYFIWRPVDSNNVTKSQEQEYVNVKTTLINQVIYDEYTDGNELIKLELKINESYTWVGISLKAAEYDLHNLQILIVNAEEKNDRTDFIYPSIGIFGNFDCALVKENFDATKKLFENIDLSYVSTEPIDELLIYLKFTTSDNHIPQIKFLSVDLKGGSE